MLIQFWKRRKKQCVSIVCSISILFSSIFFLNGCEATFLEEKKSSKEVESQKRMELIKRIQHMERYRQTVLRLRQQRRIYSRHCIHFLMKN